jgi:hypothetical protein
MAKAKTGYCWKCADRHPDCVGCASYPKDCCLGLWGGKFEDEPILQTWRWDGNGK